MLFRVVISPVVFAFAHNVTVAWSSARPAECTVDSGSAANVWERAKSPELRKYCDLVASAASKLAGTAAMAEAALAAAREANGILPGHAAPRVLEGRALAALGKLDEALAALRDGKARDPSALDDPLALHSWGRLLARTGHLPEAAEAYRALLPRTTGLSSEERAVSAIEAGLVAMASGPAAMDDAVAALREALHEAQDEALSVTALALALALDRRGDSREAQALLADRAGQVRGDPRVVFEGARAKELLAVAPKEGLAIVGLALENDDSAGALDAWTEYVAAGPSPVPWEAHARAHLAALAARAGQRRRR